MDVFTRRERSRIMGRIRSSGNAATELRLIQIFRSYKITGWRRKQKLLGKPDFIFSGETSCCVRGRMFLARMSPVLPTAAFQS